MERRGSSRRAFAAPVTLTRPESGESFEALSINVSERGMLLRSTENNRIGDVLRFAAPQFSGECEVQWVLALPGTPHMGVRFTSLDPGGKEALAEILAE